MVSRMERYVDPRHQPRINACPADNKFVRDFALQCDPLLPSLTELFNFRNRWICEEGTIAPRYERLEPLISTLAEEREGRMLNRNRFFPFSYLRNWWVESIFFENCVFLSSFLFVYLFLRRFCASLPFAEIRESNLVVLVSVKIKLKVKEMGGRWDIIRNDRLFRIGSFFFLRKNSFLVELKVMYSV